MFGKLKKRNEDNTSSSKTDLFLIAGLGNPGSQYKLTRHNLGFMVVDRIAKKLEISFSRMRSDALITDFLQNEKKIILAKPQTFMNLSGRAVSSLVNYYRIPFHHLLIIYDEVDLDKGVIRLRPAGGTAGHKGMVSIQDTLGVKEFPRLRLGIGSPPGRMSTSSYVLKKLKQPELIDISHQVDRAVDAVFGFINLGIQETMTKYNQVNK